MSNGPIIITAALNGATVHRGQCATVPYTPAELASEAGRSADAGASVIHVHAREVGGGPSYRVERYREVIAAIRERCDVLVSVSAGAFGVSGEERRTALEARPDLVCVPMGSMSWARFNQRTRTYDYDHVFANPFGDVLAAIRRARELGVAVIPSSWDLGHTDSAGRLLDMEELQPGRHHLLGLGVTGGIAANTHNLCRMADALPDAATWQVAAVGASAWRLRAGALSIGGHLRVGFEDGVLLPDGEVAESNGTLVEAAATLVRAVGLGPATAEDARRLLA